MMFMASYPAMELSAPFAERKPLACHHPLLHKAMILLNDVVHVLRGSAPAVPAQYARLLQFSDCGRVSWMAIHIDDSGPDLTRTQCES